MTDRVQAQFNDLVHRMRSQGLPPQLMGLIERLGYRPPIDQIVRANDFVNASVRYSPERIDHWKTPAETFRDGYGDCEDFAIAKGAVVAALRHTVMLALSMNHAVALVPYAGSWLAMDRLVLPLRRRIDFRPQWVLQL